MDDISIGLLKGIKKSFSSGVEESKTINDLLNKLDDKKADYEDAQKYAIEVGELLSKSFEENIDSASLPNGKMYYNIAKKVVDPELKEGFEKVSDYSTKVQKILNEDAKIGLKVQKPVYNQARSNGIVRRLADAESYDDVSWILKDPVVNFNQSVVDDTIKVNAEAHYKVGMHPKITRKVAGNACDWCMNLAGTYEYPDDVPDEVYHRHRDCRCIVTYNPGNGKAVQDVHSKKWFESEDKVETLGTQNVDYMGMPKKITFNSGDGDMKTVKVYKADGAQNIYIQNYDKQTKSMVAYLDDVINKKNKYGQIDNIIVLNNNRLKGIAAYRHDDNSLFISKELIDPNKFAKIVDPSIFPARSVTDVLDHELGGHKRHWDAVKRYKTDNKIDDLNDAKMQIESQMRKHVVNQMRSDPLYINKTVSVNAERSFYAKKSLNELIADANILVERNELSDNELNRLVKEVINYDGKSK
jgi:hypothetical protein